MKIIYFADGPWAHKAFDRIHTDPAFTITKMLLRYDSSDKILRRKAEDAGIDVLCPKNVNDPEFISELKELGADLGVSMSYNQIIKPNLMEIFPKGVINCHAGKLPYYRGRNVLNWALINGEKEIGVTCHFVDEGIDTGDIILQETFPITMKDDYGTVLEKAFDLCPRVLIKSMHLIKDNQVEAKPQPKEGSYFIERKNGDEFIDWTWTSKQVFNFVRAITDPGPFARSWVQIGGEYQLILIKEVRLVKNAVQYNCIPGGIVGKSVVNHPLVKTGDTVVEILDYVIQDSHEKKLRIGDRLGLNHNLLLLNYKERVHHAKLSEKLNSL